MTASTLVPIAPLGSTLTNVPAGNIAATTVQGAINELDTEKVAKAGDTMTGSLAIQGSGTNGSLWVSSAVNDNDAAHGIYFGLSKDSYIYRVGAASLKASGTFTATYAVGTTALIAGTNPASTGVLRISNNSWAYARNAANDADVPLLILTNTNKTALNSGVEVQLAIGTTPKFQVASGLNTSVSDLAIGTNPASVGLLRLPYTFAWYGRNSDNTANVALLDRAASYTAILDPTEFIVNIGGSTPLRATGTLVKFNAAIAVGTDPADAGALRIPNTQWLAGRNSTNTGNILIIRNAGTEIDVGDANSTLCAVGAPALSVGTNAATAGAMRMVAGQAFYWRNSGNSANHLVLQNSSSVTTVRGEDYVNVSTSAGTFLQASTTAVNVTAGATLALADGVPVTTGTSSGTKLMTATNQKFAAWNKTPDVQPTTAITGVAFVANSGTAVNDASTFGGYTLAQIAAALIREGWLA